MRIGVDLGGTKTEAIVLDADGVERHRERVDTPAGDYDAIVDTVASLVRRAERAVGATCSVGIGTPGAISPTTGLMRNSNTTCLNGRKLAGDFERALGRAIRMANDANCFTLSEAIDGAGRDGRTVFGVIIGTGTGGGIAIDRQVVVGRHAIAGEWGHNPLPWPREEELPGPECYCGKRGCIETFLSGPGLAREYASRVDQQTAPTAERVAALAGQGDEAARRVLERYVDRLARGLASVVNLLDPDVIVLGGGVSNVDALYAPLPGLLEQYVFSDRADTPVRRALHGDSSGVRGAAFLWPAS